MLRKSKKCQICGWDGPCDRAHIIPKSKGGTYKSNNVLILCPNCHRLYDYGLLSMFYLEKAQQDCVK